MDIPYQYAYLFWALFFGVIWITAYLLRPGVRKEMLLLSIVMGILGPLAELFATHDYYQPQTLFGGRIGIEDFLIGFFYGGVAAALYELFSRTRRNYSSKPGNPLLALAVIVAGFACMYAGAVLSGWTSIYVSTLFLAAVGFSIALYRPHLLKHAVITGCLFTLLTFVFFQVFLFFFPGIVVLWWRLEGISGILFNGVPLEEYLFAFAWGFAVGPASELAARLTAKDFLKPLSSKRLRI